MENQKRALLFVAGFLMIVFLIQFFYPRLYSARPYNFSDFDRQFFARLDSLQQQEADSLMAKPPASSSPARQKRYRTAASVRPVNLNSATRSQLMELPGIGPALAGRILRYRQQRGKFQKVSDLLNVKGIGPKKLEKLKPFLKIQ